MLTLEEQERLAYIQGDLAKAELLRATLDAFATMDKVVVKGSSAYQEGWDDGYSVGLEEVVEVKGSSAYQQGWDDGYSVGLEEGKRADTEGGSCD